MTVIVATKELVGCACLVAISIYTETGQFGQRVLATVATVHYFHTVSLFHMQQPYQCLLTIVVIVRVARSRYESDSVGPEETFTQHLIACRRDRYRLEKYIYVSYLNEFASKDSARPLQDREVILIIFFKRAPVVEKLRFLALVPREKLAPLLLAHLIHTVVRDVRDRAYVV